ncbi:MAG TPA: response regulator [Kouleothrix sp.]|jgi:DNA-binding response OmpR family regulator|nr:response regulator [Kouleothrix sp.]HRC75803.1 response regulator [Kouleothrix sp.]
MTSAEQAILIVDNDDSTRELYQRALSQSYQVYTASDEQNILDIVHQHAIQAVVLEPGPPNGRGWNVVSELKRNPNTSAIPIIICTAQDERRRGQALGASAYLVKPVLPTLLLQAIQLVI